MIQVDSEQDQH